MARVNLTTETPAKHRGHAVVPDRGIRQRLAIFTMTLDPRRGAIQTHAKRCENYMALTLIRLAWAIGIRFDILAPMVLKQLPSLPKRLATRHGICGLMEGCYYPSPTPEDMSAHGAEIMAIKSMCEVALGDPLLANIESPNGRRTGVTPRCLEDIVRQAAADPEVSMPFSQSRLPWGLSYIWAAEMGLITQPWSLSRTVDMNNMVYHTHAKHAAAVSESDSF